MAKVFGTHPLGTQRTVLLARSISFLCIRCVKEFKDRNPVINNNAYFGISCLRPCPFKQLPIVWHYEVTFYEHKLTCYSDCYWFICFCSLSYCNLIILSFILVTVLIWYDIHFDAYIRPYFCACRWCIGNCEIITHGWTITDINVCQFERHKLLMTGGAKTSVTHWNRCWCITYLR